MTGSRLVQGQLIQTVEDAGLHGNGTSAGSDQPLRLQGHEITVHKAPQSQSRLLMIQGCIRRLP